ncbi:hypothetical protein [Methylophaga sp.]|uniref:hypothetical protein n=1 Tax=Methylophaga sp. TaxID=2024840 RepID=UPI003A957F21
MKLNIYIDKCPCGSTKLIYKCKCYSPQSKTLHREAVVIKNGASNYGNPKCYAYPIKGCSKNISKEHFFTKAILKKYSPVKNSVKISGFPWQDEPLSYVSLDRFQSKILCETHNNILSKLDEVGLEFFNAYSEVEKLNSYKKGYNKIYLFNGYDIEKWMLKCSLGYFFSKNLQFMGERVVDRSYPPEWLLKILFSDSFLPGTRGMYLVGDIGQAAAKGGVTINLIARLNPAPPPQVIIDGYEILLNGLLFILALENPSQGSLKKTTYRPSELIFNGEEGGR